MRHVLWAGMAVMTALGLQSPAASAPLQQSYASDISIVVPRAAGTSFTSIAVNRNSASGYKGFLYVCETAPAKQIRIYSVDPSTQEWVNTGMSVTPASGSPVDVAIAPDDSIWLLDSAGKTIQSAPHPSPASPISTATIRTPAVGIGTPRALAVSGNIDNAKVYAGGSMMAEGYSVGATATKMFTLTSAALGFNVYGLTIDAAGALCAPVGTIAGGNYIKRFDPDTGAAASPAGIATKAPWMAALVLYDLDFVNDASYPGGGYFMYGGRIGTANPYKMAVYRFDGTGTYLDGFGPATTGADHYTVMHIPYSYPVSSSGAYAAPDSDGNVFVRSTDGTSGNVIRIGAQAYKPTSGPWGDVNADGKVTEADALMVEAYIANPAQFTTAQQDRIQRYGDVNNTVNQNVVGNGTVNAQDTMRMFLLAGGIIDPGTAGAAPANYGDINNDGKVDLLDAVATQRGANGLGDAATLATVNTRGRGDISPTVSSISFGDKSITQADADVIRTRAFGTEAYAPAYTDLWPLRAPNVDNPTLTADLYTFTDALGMSGDLNHQIFYQTQSPKEVNGLTVTDILGTDGSLIGVFKGTNGSVYAKYLKHPNAFGNNLLTFDSPMLLLDNSLMGTMGATWSGKTSTQPAALGFRPVTYTGTLLANESVYTPAAGSFTGAGDTPKSTWNQTARLRLDVAVHAGPTSSVEMQQAFFFDLMPFIGMVNRGQASKMGSAAPMTDRPLLRLDEVKARGVTYNQMVP